LNHIPKATFRLKNTVVPLDGDIHNPVIQVSADEFSNNNRYLETLDQTENTTIATILTTGVAYIPAVANWLKPYPPSSGGFFRNTTPVT